MEAMRVLTKPQLKVISAVCTDLAVVTLVTMIGTRDQETLFTNAIYTILLVYLALSAEKIIET